MTEEIQGCDCGLQLHKTTVIKKGGIWQVKYEWERSLEWVEFQTDKLSEILYPPSQICPYHA